MATRTILRGSQPGRISGGARPRPIAFSLSDVEVEFSRKGAGGASLCANLPDQRIAEITGATAGHPSVLARSFDPATRGRNDGVMFVELNGLVVTKL